MHGSYEFLDHNSQVVSDLILISILARCYTISLTNEITDDSDRRSLFHNLFL